MGYMRHHGILVTTYKREYAEEARAEAVKIGLLVSEIVDSRVNGFNSFAVFPDGSKEGWDESDAGDARRDALIAWLDSKKFEDLSSPFAWVEVQYGDDEGETLIVRDSDGTKGLAGKGDL